ncbi:hypothetical protein EJP82_26850 [Paenibacillus anaericanus]|uniref:S-layer homology domain-containing protein n=1 Tax=Paenibacillus anaericanus TaxID=170367 RepID=A0A3S1JWV0_9BACL|nr:fibronectin type III domain-containing protein [Paenibacillus anaericanus]RUT38693.1 hypothetical protein EJP82_26850 [Paenibacillus anaericanus]
MRSIVSKLKQIINVVLVISIVVSSFVSLLVPGKIEAATSKSATYQLSGVGDALNGKFELPADFGAITSVTSNSGVVVSSSADTANRKLNVSVSGGRNYTTTGDPSGGTLTWSNNYNCNSDYCSGTLYVEPSMGSISGYTYFEAREKYVYPPDTVDTVSWSPWSMKDYESDGRYAAFRIGSVPVSHGTLYGEVMGYKLSVKTYTYTVTLNYIPNTAPIISVSNSGDSSLYNDGGTFSILGTVQDADNDTVTVSSTIGGVTKSTTVTGTSKAKSWTLTWSGAELPLGVYTNPTVTATDSKDNVTANYSGKLTIQAQVYYYWSKFSVSSHFQLEPWSTPVSGTTVPGGITGHSSYSINPTTGELTLSGLASDLEAVGSLYIQTSPGHLDKYTFTGSESRNVYYKYSWANIVSSTVKGSLLQSNLKAAQGTYPDDAIHTDGFWYTKTGTSVNNLPVFVVSSTGNKTLYNDVGTFSVSGTVSDADNENVTVSATIGGVRKSVVVTGTSTSKAWTLSWASSEIPVGVYANPIITATDGTNIVSATYSGTLTIQAQVYYYWSKFNVNTDAGWTEITDGSVNSSIKLYKKLLRPVQWDSQYVEGNAEFWDLYNDQWSQASVNAVSSINSNGTLNFQGPTTEGVRYTNSNYRLGSVYYAPIRLDLFEPNSYSKMLWVSQLSTTPPKIKGTLSQANIKAAQGTYPDDGIYTDGYWYVKSGTVPNNMPTIAVTQAGDKSINLKTGSDTFTMSGTVQDADNETLSISATINGVSKQIAVSNTGTAKAWSLTWRTSEFLSGGTFAGPVVTVDDGRGGVATGTYTGKLTINKTALFYWDKYSVKDIPSYTEDTNWVLEFDSNQALWDNYRDTLIATTYAFNPVNGGYSTPYNTGEARSGVDYYSASGKTLYKWRIVNSVGQYCFITKYKKGVVVSSVKGKDVLLQTNIQDLDGTYPDDGIHSDGFWYTKKATTNMSPVLSVNNSDITVNLASSNLTLNGTVLDSDGDTVTVKATLNGIEKSMVVSGASTARPWSLSWTSAELPPGFYTLIPIVASDGKDGVDSITYIGTITVDKTAPSITVVPMQKDWTSDQINLEIGFSDTVSGINPNERKFKITQSADTPDSWDTAPQDIYTHIIQSEGEWYVHTATKDMAGNPTTGMSGPYKLQYKPEVPKLQLNSIGSDWAQVSWSLPDSAYTDGYKYFVENVTTGEKWTLDYPINFIQEEGLAAGTTYFYRIKAKNHVGETEYSEQLRVLTLPAAPSDLSVQTVEHNSGNATVSFKSVASAEKYNLIIKQGSDVVYEKETLESGEYPITGLKPGKQYTVSVIASNASGNGQASILGFLSLPAAPGEFKTALIKETEIELGWSPSETATQYDLLRFDESVYNGSGLTYKDSGLESSTEYDYSISATNESGYGDIAYLPSLLTLPSQVATVTVSTYGATELDINWNSVRGANGYGVTLNGALLSTVEGTSYKITGLTSGTSYQIGVYAENRSGAGVMTMLAAKTLPGQITDLFIDQIGETEATIHWNEINGADKYRITLNGNKYEVSTNQLKVSDLIGGQSYEIKVEAGNESGYGLGDNVNLLTLPPAPDQIRIKGNTAKTVQLLWDPVPSATRYSITEGKLGDLGFVGTATVDISDLIPGETYIFEIKAINETGEGRSTSFTWRTIPDVPGDIRIEEVGSNSVSLSWDLVTGAESYQIDVPGLTESVQTLGNSALIEGLSSAHKYSDIKLTPINNSGKGESTLAPSFVTLPSEKFDVKATPTQNEIKYEFDLESQNEIFVVTYKNKEVARSQDHEFILKSLSPGNQVSITVWTENEIGDRSTPRIVTEKTVPAPINPGGNGTGGNEGSGGGVEEKDVQEPPILEEPSNTDKDSNDNNSGLGVLTDIEGLYNKDQVLSLYNKGIVKGNNNKFEPKRDITRAEFMSLIVRSLELQPKESAEMRFEDINDQAWYYKELKVAFANKVIKGFSETEFRPNDTITREQATKMLANAMGYNIAGDKIFKDQKKIAFWAETEVKALASFEIIEGYPDGTFKPKNSVNRAEGVSFVYKFINTKF